MKKLILTIAFTLVLASSAFADTVCQNNYVDIRNIVTKMGFVVTSEMGGGHNSHSRHYVGKAVDVSIRKKTEFDIAMLYTILNGLGYIVRDERVRPRGQRVWRGAHFHLAVPYCQ